MNDRDAAHQKAREFFDRLWSKGDFWEIESSEYERARLGRLVEVLGGNRYERALELGCGAGAFTRRLAEKSDRVLAVDVSEEAIARARANPAPRGIEWRAANAMDLDLAAEGPFDLVVLVETVCYLGWLYPFFDVAWLAHALFEASRPGGRLLLANTLGDMGDALLLPWLIHSYRDLFRNVGWRAAHEETWRGRKNGVDLEVLITLMERPVA
jgi:2-polyprenyl-3-methyl-5-hydroxy-6-metoxy-1,4-benzoquinol methylase